MKSHYNSRSEKKPSSEMGKWLRLGFRIRAFSHAKRGGRASESDISWKLHQKHLRLLFKVSNKENTARPLILEWGLEKQIQNTGKKSFLKIAFLPEKPWITLFPSDGAKENTEHNSDFFFLYYRYSHLENWNSSLARFPVLMGWDSHPRISSSISFFSVEKTAFRLSLEFFAKKASHVFIIFSWVWTLLYSWLLLCRMLAIIIQNIDDCILKFAS